MVQGDIRACISPPALDRGVKHSERVGKGFMILVIGNIPAVIVSYVLIGLISEDPVGHHTAVLRPLVRKARKERFQFLSVAVLGIECKYDSAA